jgi:hypothetical protein
MAPVEVTHPSCFSILKVNVGQVGVRESMKQNQFVEIAQYFCNAVRTHFQYKSRTVFGAVYQKMNEN